MPSDKNKKKGSHQVGTQNKNALKLHADAKEFVPSSVSNVGSWFPRHFLSQRLLTSLCTVAICVSGYSYGHCR